MNWFRCGGRSGSGVAVADLARAVGALLTVALLAGCATVTKESSGDEKRKVVTERASARWALIIGGDAGAAYDGYMSKGSRQVIPRSEFVGRTTSTAFRTATVEEVECAGESCKVSVRITYDHRMMKGVRNTLREDWVIEDGQVWYVWPQ